MGSVGDMMEEDWDAGASSGRRCSVLVCILSLSLSLTSHHMLVIVDQIAT